MIRIVGKGYKYIVVQLTDFDGTVNEITISLKSEIGKKQYTKVFGKTLKIQKEKIKVRIISIKQFTLSYFFIIPIQSSLTKKIKAYDHGYEVYSVCGIKHILLFTEKIKIKKSKIKANASNNYTLSEEELKRVRDIIDKGIKIDEEEDSLYGDKRGDELSPELDTKEKIRKKIKEIEQSQGKKLKRAAKILIEAHTTGDENQKKKIEKKINKAEVEIEKSGQKAVSITDPESRFMENKKKRNELSYNPQITVDHDSGIIVANDVTQDCTDHHQLQPQLEMTEENVGKLPDGSKVSADNGYFTGDNLRYLEEKKLDGHIPDGNSATKMKGKKRNDSLYSKDKFEYDDKRDCFICPHGDVLERRREYEYNGKVQYHYYGAKCGECPLRADCAGVGKMRSITSDAYEAQRRRMVDKMKSEQGKGEYKKRKETVEWPFGNIKQNLGLREFFTRGLENVKTEHNLACIAHNMVVMWSKMGKNVGVLC